MQNAIALDLFGFEVPVKKQSLSSAPVAPKRSVKVQLDRRKLWGEGGYLAEMADDDDDESVHTTTSFTENATIERLEAVLGMVPVIKNGVWEKDDWFYSYRITKRLSGTRDFGKRGSILRDCQHYRVSEDASKALELLYNDTGTWLPKWSHWLFVRRLRLAAENEDPYELLAAFMEVMGQHDFLDASRKGDSLRTIVKRERMREQRAAARAAATA